MKSLICFLLMCASCALAEEEVIYARVTSAVIEAADRIEVGWSGHYVFEGDDLAEFKKLLRPMLHSPMRRSAPFEGAYFHVMVVLLQIEADGKFETFCAFAPNRNSLKREDDFEKLEQFLQTKETNGMIQAPPYLES